MFKKVILLVCLGSCPSYLVATQLPEEKKHVVEDKQLAVGNVASYLKLNFYVSIQYWSYHCWKVRKEINLAMTEEWTGGFHKDFSYDAVNFSPYHGKRASKSLLIAPVSTLANPKWKDRFAYHAKGWKHYDAQSKKPFGLLYYKEEIRAQMLSIKQNVAMLTEEQDQREALDIFIGLSEMPRFERANFLFKYIELQIRLLRISVNIDERMRCGLMCNSPEALFSLGKFYYAKGAYEQAIAYCGKALNVRETILGNQNTAVGDIYDYLGKTYYRKQAYGKAIAYYKKALMVYEKLLGNKHLSVASVYNNLGVAYHYSGYYNVSLTYYYTALKIRKEVLGDMHLEVAMVHNNLGLAYYRKHCYATSIVYFDKALKTRVKLLGKQNAQVADTCNKLSCAYNRRGTYKQAILYCKVAFHIYARLNNTGQQTPKIANLYNNLGLIYQCKGVYNKAVYYHTEALKLRQKFLDMQHADIASSYQNLGDVYYHAKAYAAALTYYYAALNIRQPVLGNQHASVADLYNNLGIIYDDQHKYETAIEHYEVALDIYEKALKGKHAQVGDVYENMGIAYYRKGDRVMWVKYRNKAIKLRAAFLKR